MSDTYDDLIGELGRQRRGDVEAARVELTLWALVKDAKRAEARMRRHPVGLELVVTVDGVAYWSQAYAPQVVETLLESAAAAQQNVFLADGWRPASAALVST